MKQYFEVIVDHRHKKVYADGYIEYKEHVTKNTFRCHAEGIINPEITSIDINEPYYLEEDESTNLTPELKEKIEKAAVKCLL